MNHDLINFAEAAFSKELKQNILITQDRKVNKLALILISEALRFANVQHFFLVCMLILVTRSGMTIKR